MLTSPIHINSKGQIVLPKIVRKALGTQNIIFEITDSQVIIKPVHTMAGALSSYKKEYKNFTEVREQAWIEVCDERQT